jgi:hypothetical protein
MECNLCERETEHGYYIASNTPIGQFMKPDGDLAEAEVDDVEIHMGNAENNDRKYILCSGCHNRLMLQVIKTMRKTNG